MSKMPSRARPPDADRHAARGRHLRLFSVIVLVLAGVAGVGLAMAQADDLLAMVVILPIVILGLALHFRGRQYAGKALAARILGDDRPDVVYLRSFADDQRGVKHLLTSGFATDEEHLADAVRPFGDMVAIGRPGELLPLPGGARDYPSDDAWRDVVRSRMKVAPLVVLKAGTGQGLHWELGETLRRRPAS